jgi:hypothetical protein
MMDAGLAWLFGVLAHFQAKRTPVRAKSGSEKPAERAKQVARKRRN